MHWTKEMRAAAAPVLPITPGAARAERNKCLSSSPFYLCTFAKPVRQSDVIWGLPHRYSVANYDARKQTALHRRGRRQGV
jgi:hypothetical protein